MLTAVSNLYLFSNIVSWQMHPVLGTREDTTMLIMKMVEEPKGHHNPPPFGGW